MSIKKVNVVIDKVDFNFEEVDGSILSDFLVPPVQKGPLTFMVQIDKNKREYDILLFTNFGQMFARKKVSIKEKNIKSVARKFYYETMENIYNDQDR